MTDTPPNLNDAERECYEVAAKATKGPYYIENIDLFSSSATTKQHRHRIARFAMAGRNSSEMFVDLESIALNADPTIVMARLRELSDLRGQVATLTAERERLRGLICNWVEEDGRYYHDMRLYNSACVGLREEARRVAALREEAGRA